MSSARIGRVVRCERGYTLTELVAVLAIFVVIVTALTSLFTAGARAELDLNRRFQAQQQARLGLDRLRRELRCADGITAAAGVPVTSISVSLPAYCPAAQGVATTVVYDTALVGDSRWKLERTKDGVTVLIADYLTNDDVFTYYAQSPSSRATLHVDLPVNVYPSEGAKQWRLVDDIVLRNTVRQ